MQRNQIVIKIERILPAIARDVFGNYVVQKLFERGLDFY
jgi:hypothetical protein